MGQGQSKELRFYRYLEMRCDLDPSDGYASGEKELDHRDVRKEECTSFPGASVVVCESVNVAFRTFKLSNGRGGVAICGNGARQGAHFLDVLSQEN